MPIDGKYYGDKLLKQRIVAYDMRLASLLNVDSANSAFKVGARLLPQTMMRAIRQPHQLCLAPCAHAQAQLQMLFSWVDQHNSSAASGLSGMPVTPACSFPCDTTRSECCDTVWVPQLKVSNLDSISSVESELAELGPLVDYTNRVTAGNKTWDQDSYECARRGWSMTLDASFDAILDFRNFPFDSQLLNVTFFNPLFHHVHYKHLAGMLQIDGAFQDITQGAPAPSPQFGLACCPVSMLLRMASYALRHVGYRLRLPACSEMSLPICAWPCRGVRQRLAPAGGLHHA